MRKTVLSTLVVVLAAWIPAFSQHEGGTGWLPGWVEQMGIELEETPAPNEAFQTLTGKVVDAAKLSQLVPGVTANETIEIEHSGYVSWSTEVEGQAVRPCVIRVRSAGAEKSTRLLPDRKTRLLRSAPPPFRGSNLKQP